MDQLTCHTTSLNLWSSLAVQVLPAGSSHVQMKTRPSWEGGAKKTVNMCSDQLWRSVTVETMFGITRNSFGLCEENCFYMSTGRLISGSTWWCTALKSYSTDPWFDLKHENGWSGHWCLHRSRDWPGSSWRWCWWGGRWTEPSRHLSPSHCEPPASDPPSTDRPPPCGRQDSQKLIMLSRHFHVCHVLLSVQQPFMCDSTQQTTWLFPVSHTFSAPERNRKAHAPEKVQQKLQAPTSRVWPGCRSLRRRSAWRSLASVLRADRSGCPAPRQEPNSPHYSRSAAAGRGAGSQLVHTLIWANRMHYTAYALSNRATTEHQSTKHFRLRFISHISHTSRCWEWHQTHSVCVADLLDVPLLITGKREEGNGAVWATAGQDQTKVVGTPADRVDCRDTQQQS